MSTATLQPSRVSATKYRRTQKPGSSKDIILSYLGELGIPVYTDEFTADYKEEQRARYYARIKLAIKLSLWLTFTAAAIAIGMVINSGTSPAGMLNATALYHATLLLLILDSMLWIVKYEGFYWKLRELSAYQKKHDIPDEASEMVATIETYRLPVVFKVESLGLDPVLWVEYKNTRTCIAIWPRPGRHQKLIR